MKEFFIKRFFDAGCNNSVAPFLRSGFIIFAFAGLRSGFKIFNSILKKAQNIFKT